MLHLLPETSLPEFTLSTRKNVAKRLAKTAVHPKSYPKDTTAHEARRSAQRTIRSLRSLLVKRDHPAARAIRELVRLVRYQATGKLPAEPPDREILLAISTVLQELDGGIE